MIPLSLKGPNHDFTDDEAVTIGGITLYGADLGKRNTSIRAPCRSGSRAAKNPRNRQRLRSVQDGRIYIEAINGPMIDVREVFLAMKDLC
jgi:hypothetical protein